MFNRLSTVVRGTLVKSKGRHPDSIRFSKSANESPRASYLPVISNSVFSQAIKPSGHLISNSLRESSQPLWTSRITCVANTDIKSPALTQNQELLRVSFENSLTASSLLKKMTAPTLYRQMLRERKKPSEINLVAYIEFLL